VAATATTAAGIRDCGRYRLHDTLCAKVIPWFVFLLGSWPVSYIERFPMLQILFIRVFSSHNLRDSCPLHSDS